jgi:hypothetical protein
MPPFLRAILDLDRRIIYTIVFVFVTLPLIFPLKIKFSPTPEVRRAFDDIEQLDPGSVVIVSCDYGPASMPETDPMYITLLHQCFRRKLRPIIMTLVPDGPGLAVRGLNKVLDARDPHTGQLLYPNLKAGVDYSYLGYKPGSSAVMLGIGQSFTATFPQDYAGNATRSQPLFKEVQALGDVQYIFDIAAVGMPEAWLPYGATRWKKPMSVSCTAVSAAQYYPYYASRQFKGLVGGMKGSAEYEKLAGMEQILGRVPDATRGMDAQSLVHIFIVLSIIIANVLYFIDRRQKVAERRAG